MTAACDLLNLNLEWEQEAEQDASLFTVDVIGASPSDETVLINVIHVNVGDKVEPGQVLVILGPANLRVKFYRHAMA